MLNKQWHRSTRSGQGGNCVEARRGDEAVVEIQDSKNVGPIVRVDRSAWQRFLADVTKEQ